MSIKLCLPVVKFSYATGVNADNSIPWTHLTASDIYVIIEGMQAGGAPLLMRIVQGTATLEDVDVGAYIEAALDARRGAKQAGVEATVEQLPIFGITKEALLAVRYRQQNGQARRLQLRMTTSADCKRIVEVFQTRGMEFQAQRPGTARRPGTAATDLSRPMTARQGLAELEIQASTARHVSPHFRPPSESRLVYSQAVPAMSLSSGQVSVPLVGGSSQPERQGPRHKLYQRQSLSPERSPSRPSMPPGRLLSHDEYATPMDALPSHPSAAMLYRAHTTPSQQAQIDQYVQPDRRVFDSTGSRPTSPYRSTLNAMPEGFQQRPPEHGSSKMPPFPWRLSDSGDFGSSDTLEMNDSALGSDGRPATTRPLTSTATSLLPDTLEHEIPPRRDLPFKRPESRHSGSNRAGSRPGSSALELPPLKKPTVVAESSAPPKLAAPSSRPGTASPLKRSFEVMADPDPPERPQTAMPPPSEHYLTRPISPPYKPVGSEAVPASRPSRMDELLHGKRALLEKSSNIRRLNSIADAEHEIVSPVGSPAKPTKQSNEVENMSGVLAFKSLHSPGRDAHEADSLAEYAAQSAEDRDAALNHFMCENIENPAFVTLCEDVENCWRRIALGL